MIDLFKTNGSSLPAHHHCGTTLGAACWAGSLFAGQRVYHAPCAEPLGHCGACFCGRCGTVIAMRRTPIKIAEVTTRTPELMGVAAYAVTLAAVAMTVIDALPVAALIGAVWLRLMERGAS